jgi:hypothetical protein
LAAFQYATEMVKNYFWPKTSLWIMVLVLTACEAAWSRPADRADNDSVPAARAGRLAKAAKDLEHRKLLRSNRSAEISLGFLAG